MYVLHGCQWTIIVVGMLRWHGEGVAGTAGASNLRIGLQPLIVLGHFGYESVAECEVAPSL